MRNIQKIVLMIICFVFIAKYQLAFAYHDEKTHPLLNEKAATQSILDDTMKDLLWFNQGLETSFKNKTAVEWFKKGGESEDQLPRPINHFHDPFDSWDQAGLGPLGTSALVWAQNNSYSWNEARNAFYMALITSLDGQYLLNGEHYYKQTFRSLGQVMHLVSDMAVPSQVRNDSHPGPLVSWAVKSQKKDEFETFVADHQDKVAEMSGIEVDLSIFDYFVPGVSDAPSPISALFDQNRYSNGDNPDTTWSCDLGLAEFTNANFYSQDTIHTDKYTYPNDTVFNNIDYSISEPVKAEDGEYDNAVYYENRTHGYRMAQAGYFDHLLISRGFTPTLKLDDNVYMDYASILLPRAIGYSAALLDYFFRGKIDLENDTANAEGGYVIKNDTDEDMDGLFELYYINSEGDKSKISDFNYNGQISANGQSENIQFSIPADIDNEGMLTLVFRGILGEEEDAVVGKVIDIKHYYVVVQNEDYCTIWDPKENRLAEIEYPETGNSISLPATTETIQPWLDAATAVTTQNLFTELVEPSTDSSYESERNTPQDFECIGNAVWKDYEKITETFDENVIIQGNTEILCEKSFVRYSTEHIESHDVDHNCSEYHYTIVSDYIYNGWLYARSSPFGELLSWSSHGCILHGNNPTYILPGINCPNESGTDYMGTTSISIHKMTNHLFVQLYGISTIAPGSDHSRAHVLHAAINWYENTAEQNPCSQNRHSSFESAISDLMDLQHDAMDDSDPSGGGDWLRTTPLPTIKIVAIIK